MDETEDSVNYGLVGYPVLQTADIILYKADTVPVGQDQVPHLELAREIVRRFNNRYGETFPEPQAKLTEAPLILGLDGRQKMSKSLDNHLELAATPEDTTRRLASAFTDPQRQRRTDPGRPEVCNIYSVAPDFQLATGSRRGLQRMHHRPEGMRRLQEAPGGQRQRLP